MVKKIGSKMVKKIGSKMVKTVCSKMVKSENGMFQKGQHKICPCGVHEAATLGYLSEYVGRDSLPLTRWSGDSNRRMDHVHMIPCEAPYHPFFVSGDLRLVGQ